MDAPFLARVAIGILMLMCAFELWKIAIALQSPLLFSIVRRSFYVVLIFGIGRLIASFIDRALFDDSIGYLTTATVVGFWLLAWFFFYQHRTTIETLPLTDKVDVGQSLDKAIRTAQFVKTKVDDTIVNGGL